MSYKFAIILILIVSIFTAGCHHAKVVNPIANVDSKQPDKVLYDRALDAMKGGKYVVARTLLDTLINTYPDSEYIARAKLSLGDSWFAEGGTAGLQQAEAEYKDFITFFPNLPEAAEAQLKVANIHYRQMEKADRDFTQATRAEDEFRTLIRQFPDSKLVPEATQKLRDVQEILAERQYGIAHFYYLRDNMAASQARLRSLVDSYPLYSRIDEALLALGDIYERQANALRRQNLPAGLKEKLVAEYEKNAIDAYTKLVSRYPVMRHADDAKQRLADLKAPVPTPTPEAIARNKAEEDGREEIGRFRALRMNFSRHPDFSRSSKAGEPSMENEEIVSAAELVQNLNQQLKDAVASAQGGANTAVGIVKPGDGKTPGPNDPPPGSKQDNTTSPKPPDRTNDLQSSAAAQNATDTPQATDSADSSSKKKGKKGLRKIIPF